MFYRIIINDSIHYLAKLLVKLNQNNILVWFYFLGSQIIYLYLKYKILLYLHRNIFFRGKLKWKLMFKTFFKLEHIKNLKSIKLYEEPFKIV